MKVYFSIVLFVEIQFFGAVLSGNGLYSDPNKAEKIKLLPSPINVAEIQKVLGIITCHHLSLFYWTLQHP